MYDAIRVRAPASILESLFQTTLYKVREENDKSGGYGVKFIGTFSIPTHIASHIDMVTGITELPPPLHRHKRKQLAERTGERAADNAGCNVPYTIKNAYRFRSI